MINTCIGAALLLTPFALVLTILTITAGWRVVVGGVAFFLGVMASFVAGCWLIFGHL